MENIALCFDYFGTLIRVEEPFQQLKLFMRECLENRGYEIDINKFFGQFTRYRATYESGEDFLCGKDILRLSFLRTCKKFNVKEFTHEFLCFAEKIFSESPAYEDSHEVIKCLKRKYRVGVISNTDNDIIIKSIKKQKFEFDFLITSEDAQSNKPDAGIFFYAMKMLGRKENEFYMIGDSLAADICGAGRLGIPSIWVNRRKEIRKEGSCKPYFIVSDLKEILPLFLSDF